MEINELEKIYPPGTRAVFSDKGKEYTGTVVGYTESMKLRVLEKPDRYHSEDPETGLVRVIEKPEYIKVLLVEPGRYPREIEIYDRLDIMQETVGGYIEEFAPSDMRSDEVAIICNENGKLMGLPLNRAIYGSDGQVEDIIAGRFFICSVPSDSDRIRSLSAGQFEKYYEMFKNPERFYISRGKVSVEKYKPIEKETGAR